MYGMEDERWNSKVEPNKAVSCAPGPWGGWRAQLSLGEHGFLKRGKGKKELDFRS